MAERRARFRHHKNVPVHSDSHLSAMSNLPATLRAFFVNHVLEYEYHLSSTAHDDGSAHGQKGIGIQQNHRAETHRVDQLPTRTLSLNYSEKKNN